MLRNVRDAGAFIGVMIYAVSLASLFKIAGRAEFGRATRVKARRPDRRPSSCGSLANLLANRRASSMVSTPAVPAS